MLFLGKYTNEDLICLDDIKYDDTEDSINNLFCVEDIKRGYTCILEDLHNYIVSHNVIGTVRHQELVRKWHTNFKIAYSTFYGNYKSYVSESIDTISNYMPIPYDEDEIPKINYNIETKSKALDDFTLE